MNREDVVQAALTVERWCRKHYKSFARCDCPIVRDGCYCHIAYESEPRKWKLEEFLRTRGMKDADARKPV